MHLTLNYAMFLPHRNIQRWQVEVLAVLTHQPEDNACPHQLAINDQWAVYIVPATWLGPSWVVTWTCCLPSAPPFWVVPNCCFLSHPSPFLGKQKRFCTKLGDLTLKSLRYVFSVNFKLISLRNNVQRGNKPW